MGGAHPDQLVKFDLDRSTVSILGILNEENHQKGHDGGARVNNQLPGVRIIEDRARDRPDHDGERRKQKGGGASRGLRGAAGDIAEDLRQPTLLLVFMAALFVAHLFLVVRRWYMVRPPVSQCKTQRN